jgi:tRNA(Ile)-lysidine synthase
MARFHSLVAVSGGADSVALLVLLHGLAKRFSWRLTVAHLDHGIRSRAAAGGDAAFVAALAKRLKIPCVVGRARVPALARRRGISLEMAAREARYAFLVRTARTVKADVIATAHTADDQVETILLKLLRGAGRGGLSGMAAATTVGGIPLLRPLLEVSRREIESLLREQQIPWREDESNRDPAFLRNRVRHELLPLLERDYNPNIRATLLRSREVMAAEDAWLDEIARGILEDCAPDATLSTQLQGYPLAARRRVIRLWLVRQGVLPASLDFDGVARVDKLLERNRGSRRVELPGGWQVERRYDRLSAVKGSVPGVAAVPEVPAVRLKVPGVTRVKALNLRIMATLAPGVVKDRGAGPGVFPARATLSAKVLKERDLWVRPVKAGDRILPFGMTGSRKIQDILVDAKVPRAERALIPVLTCADRIVWLPGYRIARNCAVDDAHAINLQLTATHT